MSDITTYPRPAITSPPEADELAARRDETEALAERFQALADANRLRALHLLHTRGEMCACELQAVLDVSASNLSFHLQVLRHAGFVKARKEGKWTFYRLVPGEPMALLATLGALFQGEPPAGASCACGAVRIGEIAPNQWTHRSQGRIDTREVSNEPQAIYG